MHLQTTALRPCQEASPLAAKLASSRAGGGVRRTGEVDLPRSYRESPGFPRHRFNLVQELTLYALAALFVWIGGLIIYQLAIAYVGEHFGMRVREISIGIGSTLLRFTSQGCTYRLAAIPFGSYTKFVGPDEVEVDAGVSFQDEPLKTVFIDDLPPSEQMLTYLSGPLAIAIFGIACLAVPIWTGAPELQVCTKEASQVRPCGVGGLRLGEQPTSWKSQVALFRNTAVEFTIRLISFQSMEGWGGLVSYFVTVEAVGKLSVSAWLSSVGVMLLWLGVFNMLPVPPLIGFLFLESLARWVTGRRLPKGVRQQFFTICLLVLIAYLCRAIWIDAVWLWRALGG